MKMKVKEALKEIEAELGRSVNLVDAKRLDDVLVLLTEDTNDAGPMIVTTRRITIYVGLASKAQLTADKESHHAF